MTDQEAARKEFKLVGVDEWITEHKAAVLKPSPCLEGERELLSGYGSGHCAIVGFDAIGVSSDEKFDFTDGKLLIDVPFIGPAHITCDGDLIVVFRPGYIRSGCRWTTRHGSLRFVSVDGAVVDIDHLEVGGKISVSKGAHLRVGRAIALETHCSSDSRLEIAESLIH